VKEVISLKFGTVVVQTPEGKRGAMASVGSTIAIVSGAPEAVVEGVDDLVKQGWELRGHASATMRPAIAAAGKNDLPCVICVATLVHKAGE